MLSMTIPLWVLLAFATWTMIVLVVSVGVHRWFRILTRRDPIHAFAGGGVVGTPFHRRAMRAHLNCVENLPVYGALVLVALAADVHGPWLDIPALVLMGARVCHTLIHLSLQQTDVVVAVRFSFFATQVICMMVMAINIASHLV